MACALGSRVLGWTGLSVGRIGLSVMLGLALAAACDPKDKKTKVPDEAGGEGGAPAVVAPVGGDASGSVGGEAPMGGEPGGGGQPLVDGPIASAGTGAAVAGASATGGTSAVGGASTGGTATTITAGTGGVPPVLEKFSFFVTSQNAMVTLSQSPNGFGGDLRHGEATGLAGADKICSEIAETSMAGASTKVWRAFLSTTTVNARDRVGPGPWYDRTGRLVAATLANLLADRPSNADPAIRLDLPNEFGIPNHQPDAAQPAVVNGHVLTGSNAAGTLFGATATCLDWTSNAADNAATGRPQTGFSWAAQGRTNWISGVTEGGCGAAVQTITSGDGDPGNPTVSSGGGYGAIYCFALTE